MKDADTVNELYADAVVIDALNVSNWDSPAVFQSLRAGGLTAINATLATWENYRETMDNIAAWLRRFDHYEFLLPVKNSADILAAKKSGKVGIIFGSQNSSPIENDLDRLALFHALGMRIMQLTFHERNLLGNGCFERRDDGLSNFGVDAVREMNRLGILIDLSHVGDQSTVEAIACSEQPVAITHANARSYCDHRRNKTDEALKLLAEKGGVIGAAGIVTLPAEGSRLHPGRLRRRDRRPGGESGESITWESGPTLPRTSRNRFGGISSHSRGPSFPQRSSTPMYVFPREPFIPGALKRPTSSPA